MALTQKNELNSSKKNQNSNNNLSIKTNENVLVLKDKIYTLKKWNYGLIAMFFVVLLLLIFIVGAFIGLWQNNQQFFNENKQMMLSNVSLKVLENKSNNVSVKVLSNTLTGVTYTQNVKLDVSNLKTRQVVRGKATLTKANGESVEIELAEHGNWKLGTDGYLYYCNIVDETSNILLCEQVELKSGVLNVENNSGMSYLTFTVESLSYDGGFASLLWVDAPQNWLNS